MEQSTEVSHEEEARILRQIQIRRLRREELELEDRLAALRSQTGGVRAARLDGAPLATRGTQGEAFGVCGVEGLTAHASHAPTHPRAPSAGSDLHRCGGEGPNGLVHRSASEKLSPRMKLELQRLARMHTGSEVRALIPADELRRWTPAMEKAAKRLVNETRVALRRKGIALSSGSASSGATCAPPSGSDTMSEAGVTTVSRPTGTDGTGSGRGLAHSSSGASTESFSQALSSAGSMVETVNTRTAEADASSSLSALAEASAAARGGNAHLSSPPVPPHAHEGTAEPAAGTGSTEAQSREGEIPQAGFAGAPAVLGAAESALAQAGDGQVSSERVGFVETAAMGMSVQAAEAPPGKRGVRGRNRAQLKLMQLGSDAPCWHPSSNEGLEGSVSLSEETISAAEALPAKRQSRKRAVSLESSGSRTKARIAAAAHPSSDTGRRMLRPRRAKAQR